MSPPTPPLRPVFSRGAAWSPSYLVVIMMTLCALWPVANTCLAAELGLTIEGLKTPPTLANGLTVTQIPVVVRDEVSSLLLGEAELTGTADVGEVLDAWSPGPGLYLIRYRPPAVQRPQEATLSLEIRQGERLGRGQVAVQLTPAGWGSIEILPRPAPIILGQDPGAQVTFIPRDASGQPYPARNLIIDASQGEIGAIKEQGDGRFAAPFTLPEATWPQLSILTAVDPDAPDERYGFHVLPMIGRTRFPVQTEPGVKLTFSIGDRVFDPIVTDPEGFAQAELLVEPGDSFATVESIDVDGAVQVERLDLTAPESRMLALIAPPRGIPGDGTSPVTLRLLAVNPDGSPREGAYIKVDAKLGAVAEVVDEGAGLYLTTYTPPLLQDASATDTLVAQLLPESARPLPEPEGPESAEASDILKTPPTALASDAPEAASAPDPTDAGDALTAPPASTPALTFDSAIQRHEVRLKLLLPGQGVPTHVPVVTTAPDPVEWVALTLSQEQIPPGAPTEVTLQLKGYGSKNTQTRLSPDIQLFATSGEILNRRVEADGTLKATLSLPALKEGASVSVLATEPDSGLATWTLIYAGDAPDRSLPPEAGPVVRLEGAPPTDTEAEAEIDPIAEAKTEPEADPSAKVEPTTSTPGANTEGEVLAPPPKSLRLRGTRLYPLYAAGMYQYSQDATVPDSPVADGYGISAPTLFGIGLGVDHWLRQNLGVSARYLVGNYGFDPGDRLAVPGPISSFYHVGTADLRFRAFKHLEDGGFSLGLRLGGGRMTHPFFENQSQGVVYLDNNILWIVRGGIDFDALVMGNIEIAARYDLGMDPASLTPATHHGELGVGWRANEVVSVGITGETWARSIQAQGEGETLGMLSDLWVLGWIYVAVHY